jgi:DNA-binding CsgD family transcriptional regulator
VAAARRTGGRRPGQPRTGCRDDGQESEDAGYLVQVLLLVGRGQPNSAIASSLFIAETTVKTHIARILTKLGLADRAQAVVLAYETGLVQPGENSSLLS